jgi:nicotinamide riboside transporter PnuC
VVDSVAAALYWSQGLYATAVLFVVYVVIAVRGYFAWRADLALHPAAAAGRARA